MILKNVYHGSFFRTEYHFRLQHLSILDPDRTLYLYTIISRLAVEMDSVSESPESDQPTQQTASSVPEGRKQQEWILVAAGIERFFFLIYTANIFSP